MSVLADRRRGRARGGLWLPAALLIVFVGGWLRFAYLNRGYIHTDEAIACAVVNRLHQTPGWDTDWGHTSIGNRYGATQYNFSSYYLTLAGWDRLIRAFGIVRGPIPPPPVEPPNLETRIGAASKPLVNLRFFSALLGTLALPLVLRLARNLTDPLTALGVGAWAAVNPQLVQDSHYARPETFLTLLALMLVALCLPDRHWSWSRGAAAGALFGFMAACKITMVFLGWVPFLLCLPLPFRSAARPPVRVLAARVGLVAAALAVGFVAGVPRVLVDPQGYWAGLEFLRQSYSRGMGSLSHFHHGMVGDYLVGYLFDTTGWWMVALFAGGLVVTIARRERRNALVIFAPVLTTLGYFCLQRTFFERNFSHVVPLYLVGAGIGWAALVRLRPSLFGPWRPALLAVLFAATLALPSTMSARMVRDGFSGHAQALAADLEAAIRQRYAGLEAFSIEGSLAAGPRIFRRAWHDGNRPFLIFWRYSNEPPTSADYRRLSAAFDWTTVGMVPGLFDDLKTPSGFKEYFPCRTEVFLVRGPRSPANPASR